MSHKPGGRLSLLSARPAVTLATLKRAATSFIIIIHEYYYGGAVALLLQDHLTMSVSRRESIYRETLLAAW